MDGVGGAESLRACFELGDVQQPLGKTAAIPLPPALVPGLCMVTNAIRHGARAGEDELIELVLWIADGHCWLAVSDPGAGRPVLVEPHPQECEGRGLLLVDALCDIWAVVPRRTCGKSVVAGVGLRVA
ncbi:ATP-binding protein [Kitasatospora sp. NPDC052868]|uniref:ATP-binding protein n=1 Tax=Kitasatospora sp. NPDC052868 TaxID=3364060 RepID=UPI0037CA1086